MIKIEDLMLDIDRIIVKIINVMIIEVQIQRLMSCKIFRDLQEMYGKKEINCKMYKIDIN